MSLKAIQWAWKQQIKPGEKLVLLALANYANTDDKAWPGQKTLAYDCGMNRDTVVNHLAALVRYGLINSEDRRTDKGHKQSACHQLRLDVIIPNVGKSDLGEANVGKSDLWTKDKINHQHKPMSENPTLDKPMSEFQEAYVGISGKNDDSLLIYKNRTVKGESKETLSLDIDPPAMTDLHSKPLHDKQENSSSTKKPEKQKIDYSMEFEEIWKIYPAGRGGIKPKKQDAFRCYGARRKEGATAEQLLTATINYRERCDKENYTGVNYVFNASTFFGPNKEFENYAKPTEIKNNTSQQSRRLEPSSREELLASKDFLDDYFSKKEAGMRQLEEIKNAA